MHRPFPETPARTKQGPFPSPQVVLSCDSSGTTTPSDALPARCDFPLERVYAPAPPSAQARGGGGPPQFPPPPSARSAPLTPGGSSTVHARLFPSSMAFALLLRARLLLGPFRVGLTTRQASLDAADRTVAPPLGLLTLRFDAGRFPPTPAACYRASWQLPGRDLHPLAAASLRIGRAHV